MDPMSPGSTMTSDGRRVRSGGTPAFTAGVAGSVDDSVEPVDRLGHCHRQSALPTPAGPAIGIAGHRIARSAREQRAAAGGR